MTTDAARRDFGMRGLQDALDRVADAAHDDVPHIVTEVLYWAAALDEHYERLSLNKGVYFDRQKQHQDGKIMYALRYARGRITHTLDVPSRLIEAAFQAGAFQAEPSWTWVGADVLGLRRNHGARDIDRQNRYRQVVEGWPVLEPLQALIGWFDNAESNWPSR